MYLDSMMKKIPQQVLIKFENGLLKNNILADQQFFYKKWLRYYFDFCSKYKHDSQNPESLPHFINKLREKKTN
jgi:hypothetical protein